MPPITETPSSERPLIPTLRRFLPYLWPADAPALRLAHRGGDDARGRIEAAAGLRRRLCHALCRRPHGAGRPERGVDRHRAGAGLCRGRVSARRCSTICATPCSSASGRKRRAGWRPACSGTSTSCRLRFHLERRTGAVTKVVERGTKSIDTMLYFMLFNIAADAARVGAGAHHLLEQFRPVAGRLDRSDGRDLYLFHPAGDGLARGLAHPDERPRHRRRLARGRFAAEFRDGQIFQRRGARGAALRQGDAGLCDGGGAQREFARLAEYRPGADHQRDDGDRHGRDRLGMGQGPVSPPATWCSSRTLLSQLFRPLDLLGNGLSHDPPRA